MKKQNFSNKAIMERLDKLEKRNSEMSAIFLLYSLAIAFVIGYVSTVKFEFLIAGVFSYGFGILLSIKHKIKV